MMTHRARGLEQDPGHAAEHVAARHGLEPRARRAAAAAAGQGRRAAAPQPHGPLAAAQAQDDPRGGLGLGHEQRRDGAQPLRHRQGAGHPQGDGRVRAAHVRALPGARAQPHDAAPGADRAPRDAAHGGRADVDHGAHPGAGGRELAARQPVRRERVPAAQRLRRQQPRHLGALARHVHRARPRRAALAREQARAGAALPAGRRLVHEALHAQVPAPQGGPRHGGHAAEAARRAQAHAHARVVRRGAAGHGGRRCRGGSNTHLPHQAVQARVAAAAHLARVPDAPILDAMI
ncbi:hypothetical protein ON010_g6551 [Phytophthora cinnamomi]|nr:hypothetical protein ON010_g6551 [Phytophthora cinnamomi]